MKCHDLGDLNGTKQHKLPCFIDNTLLQVVRQNALIITSLRDSFKFPPSAPYRRAACMKSPKKIFRMLLHVCKVHRNGLELGELRKLEIARERREKVLLFLQLCIVLLLLQFHILRKIFSTFHRSSKLVINPLASIITS